ncbi:MAG TPA: hypothetical protein VFQ91_19290 [Bryobacteraceae bacterium]|nr:hypothetical protein [Bryobacteraceae bacterium]
MMEPYPVALFNPGEKEFNTIALPGMDIVIPLQEDLDCDPLQDDEIRLAELGGGYERIVKSSDPEAVPERGAGLIHYHFPNVPPGLYQLAIRIAGQWLPLASDLVITPKGAFIGKKKLGSSAPKLELETRKAPEPPPLPPSPPSDPRWLPRKFMDQNPNRWDRES